MCSPNSASGALEARIPNRRALHVDRANALRWSTNRGQSRVRGELEPHPYGNSPRNLSGPTDTSVALADILKRVCAGRLVARLLGAVRDSLCDLRLAKGDGAFLKVMVTRVETPADQGERVSVTTAGTRASRYVTDLKDDIRPRSLDRGCRESEFCFVS
jgi:hypothetical protein